MRTLLILVLCLGAAAFVTLRPPRCGRARAVACPAPELDNGLGRTLPRAVACASAGYLCQGSGAFQVQRWPLEHGRLRVRIPPPPVDDRAEARRLLDAALAGVTAWNGHPFPLLIDTGRFPRRPWDVELYWVPESEFGSMGGGGNLAGVTAIYWSEAGEKPEFKVNSISTVAFERDRTGREVPASSALVSQVAAHEMGHALGLQHSDRAVDVMAPSTETMRGVTARDLQSVDALYRLPNGARIAGG